MNRKHRIVHLVSLVAILVSLFSPILTLPVLADQATPEPDVTLTTGEDDSTTPAGQDLVVPVETDPVEGPQSQTNPPTQNDPPVEPTLIAVVPAAPIISAATCGEGVVYAQTATAPVTEGVNYQIGAPDAAGNFTITATITDASTYQWADSGLDGWIVNGNQATSSGTLTLCPVPEPDVEEPAKQEIPIDSGETGDTKLSTPEPDVKNEIPAESSEAGDTLASTPEPDLTNQTPDDSGETGDTEASTPDANLTGEIPESAKTGIAAASTPDSLSTPTAGTHASGMNLGTTDVQQITMSMTVGLSGPIQPGSTITYTLSLKYDGPYNVSYTFDGTLPEGTTVKNIEYPDIDMSNKCIVTGQQISCDPGVDNKLYGIPSVWKITVTVNADFVSPSTCTNGLVAGFEVPQYAIEVVNPEPSTLSIDPSYCTQNVEMSHSVWNIIPTSNPATEILPGMIYDYRYQVTNNSALPVSDFSFNANLPDGVVANWGGSIFPSGCSVTSQSTGQITCTEPLNSGNDFLIRISGNVPQDASLLAANACIDGLVSSATLMGANWNTATNAHSLSANVPLDEDECPTGLSLDVSADSTSVSPGDSITYSVTVTNPAPSVNTDPFQFDVFWDGSVFTLDNSAFTLPTGINCNVDANFDPVTASCEGNASIVNTSIVVDFPLTVRTDLGFDMCQTSDIIAVDRAGDWEPSTGKTLEINVNCGSLSISTSSSGKVDEGESFVINVTVANIGSADTEAYKFTIPLPQGLDFEYVTGVIPDGPASCDPGRANGITTIYCEGPGIPADSDPHEYYITLLPSYDLNSDICAAPLDIPANGTDGPWGAQRTHSSSVTVTCVPLLEIGIESDKSQANYGETVTFTITVTNNGSANSGVYQFMAELSADSYALAHMDPPVITAPAGITCLTAGSFTAISCSNPDTSPQSLIPGGTHVFQVETTVKSKEICGVVTSVAYATGDNQMWAEGARFGSGTNPSISTSVNCNSDLMISIVDDVAGGESVVPGDEINYTVTVINTGTTPVYGYEYSLGFEQQELIGFDAMGYESFRGCYANQRPNPTLIDCKILAGGTLLPGEDNADVYTFIGTVAPAAPALCSGGVRMLPTLGLGFRDGLEISLPIAEVDCSLLTLDKTDNLAEGETVDLYEEYTYTITVANTGLERSGDFSFVDKMPMGVVPTGALDSRCISATVNNILEITCSDTGLPSGDDNTVEFDINVQMVPIGGVGCANRSDAQNYVSGESGIWDPSKKIAREFTDIECKPTLKLNFKANKTEVEPGDTITYTATIKNTGSFAEDEYHIDISVPTGTVVYGISSSWAAGRIICYPISFSTTLISCSGTNVPPNQEHIISYSVRVTTAIDDALCANGIQSSITEGTGEWDADNPTSHGTPLLCPELSISMTDNLADDESVDLNGSLIYTYAVTNTGDSAIGDFSFVTMLPPGVVIYNLPNETDCSWSLVDDQAPQSQVECTGSQVPVGEGNGLTFSVLTLPADIGTIAACEDISATVNGEDGIWKPDGKSDQEDTFVECISSVDFAINALDSPVVPGESIGFEVIIHNTGNTRMRGIGTFDQRLPVLPDDEEWQRTLTLNGNPVTSGEFPAELVAGDILRLTLISIDIPTSISLPETDWCRDWTLGATLEASFTRGAEQRISKSATVQVNCTGLSSVQEVSSGTILPGGQVEYTITITNVGNTTVESLIVFHEFSETNTVFSNWEVSGNGASGCIVATLGPACLFDSLEPEAKAVVTVVGDAPLHPTEQQCAPVSSQAMFYYLTVETPPSVISSTGLTPPVTEIFSEPVTTQLDCIASFAFTNEALASPVIPGENIGYELTVHNNGTLPISSLSLTPNTLPTLPAGVWIYTAALNDVSIDPNALPTLEAGDTLVYTMVSEEEIPIDLTLPETEWCQEWTSSYTVTAGFDWESDHVETDFATVQVNCTGLSVVQDVSSATIQPGDQVQYTITVTNDGNTTVAPLTVYHDVTETGTVFSNWTATGATNCDLAMPTGAGCTFAALAPFESVQVIVTADAPLNPTIAQCAPISGAAAFTYTGLTTPIVSEPVTTQIDCQPAVDIALDGDLNLGTNNRVDADDTVTYTLMVTNSGNITLYGITVNEDGSGLEWDKPLTIAELLPEQSETFTATYTITQADIDAGFLETTISVQALIEPATAQTYLQVLGFASAQIAPVLPPSVGSEITERIDLPQEPAMQLEVSRAGTDEPGLGDTITYNYTVTNSGNVTLTDIEIVPDMSGLNFPDGTIATLAPGEEAVITGTYTVTQADVETGSITMCADGLATDPGAAAVNETDACVTYQIAQPQPTVTPTPVIPATPEPTAPATPEVTATPEPTAPATPEVPATPDATPDASETPTATQDATQGVSGLPETGNGPGVITPIIWLAATIGVLALGIGGITIRRYR